MLKVTIIQRVLAHYRVPFFVELIERLSQIGIQLNLIYGQEYPGSLPKSVQLDKDWARRITNAYSYLPGISDFVWQPCLRYLRGSDLVVVEQANKLLLNYLLFFVRKYYKIRLAYWGHGKNMQDGTRGILSERIKRILTSQVDWWFAYTHISAEIVASTGFPREKITTVQNTINTEHLKACIANITPDQLHTIKKGLNINTDSTCIYCGRMYADKKLDFLVNCCLGIKSVLPDFEMIFLGSGPEESKIESFAAKHPWVHYLGPKFGANRLPYFMLARALLMPGPVGLAIVDGFVTRVPLITTDITIHGPEIFYLESGINGLMTPHSEESYVRAVVDYLSSETAQERLKKGCSQSAKKITMKNMVSNFAHGIQNCLSF